MRLSALFRAKDNLNILCFSLIAGSLMMVDINTQYLKPVRLVLGYSTEVFYKIAGMPNQAWLIVQDITRTNIELHDENKQLKERILLYQAQLQKLTGVTTENNNLRKLLNSAQVVEDKVLIGEIIGIDANATFQRIIINQGVNQGVFVGQAVLDADGILGQVVEVMPNSARVLLISDVTHAIPVLVIRNGLRGVVAGTGENNTLQLLYVTADSDIKAGDTLVSSGLGMRFPADYPVAKVTKVEIIPNQIFAKISLKPMAKLEQIRYVLLVLKNDT